MCCGYRTSSGPAGGCGSARLWHDHRTDVGDGGLVASLAGAAGGDGIHQPYWKGVCYLLEAEGFECWLVNALFSSSILGWVALATTEGHPCWVPAPGDEVAGSGAHAGPEVTSVRG